MNQVEQSPFSRILQVLVGLFCAVVMALCAPPAQEAPHEAELVELIDDIEEVTPVAAKPHWLTWPEAHAEQLRTGQPVLVLVSFEGCAPCVRLKKLIDQPGNLNRLAELGIPCLGHCRDWQTDDKTKWRAPAIVYADGREEPPMLTNLSFATADDFFDQLTGWINAND